MTMIVQDLILKLSAAPMGAAVTLAGVQIGDIVVREVPGGHEVQLQPKSVLLNGVPVTRFIEDMAFALLDLKDALKAQTK